MSEMNERDRAAEHPVAEDPAADESVTRDEPAPPDTGTSTAAESDDPLRRSRTSHTWLAVIGLAVVLILLIIFIAQNTQRVHVSFLSLDGHASLAVVTLIAGVAGVVITAIAGSLRIVQLRRRVKRART